MHFFMLIVLPFMAFCMYITDNENDLDMGLLTCMYPMFFDKMNLLQWLFVPLWLPGYYAFLFVVNPNKLEI